MRGTPQQIIDKYSQLARDSQLGNDRVATENFQQHAEHYTRMLGEAQRDADARREQQEAQNRERQRERDDNRDHSGGGNDQPHVQSQPHGQSQPAAQSQPQSQPHSGGSKKPDPVFVSDSPKSDSGPAPVRDSSGEALNVVDAGADEADNGLVETPEEAPAKPRARRTRKPKPKPEAKADSADAPKAETAKADAPKAAKSKADKPKAKAAKPKPEASSDAEPAAQNGDSEPKEAAE